MAVDLEELVPELQIEVNPPGQDNFPDATGDEWLNNLRNAFWEARLYGFWSGFSEADGLISEDANGDDLGRDQQQLIVLFAAARIIRNVLQNTNTMFRAQAGPVEFETQNSAQLLRDILKDIRSRVDLALAALGTLNDSTVTYIDSLTAREDSIGDGNTFWVR